uniref:CSON014418 protein n=1 Tax=Culicoides sonorensis TaxID=179676 RepID=A0A336LHX0_CULSO
METNEEQNMEPDDLRSSATESEKSPDKEDLKRKLDETGTENDESPNKSAKIENMASDEFKMEKDETNVSENEKDDNSQDDKDLFDAEQKLKEMDEVSVRTVPKGQSEQESDQTDAKKRKVTNLRKNIKDVLDETQLDASTLAAQKEEMERLARVQEQQRVLREMQRHAAMDKFSKTEEKVLQFLQGHANLGKPSTSMPLQQEDNQNQQSSNLTPSVTIRPVSSSEKGIVSEITTLTTTTSSTTTPVKKDVVTISSDEEDCIVLSDDDEIDNEPDEDPNNCGLHTNDTYNVPDEHGRVLVNVGHAPNEPDLFLAPQLGKIVKPHQIGGIRFLFDNIIESTSRYDTSSGFGCILAHSMGLGKTLQVVSFCDIFLRHTSSKTVLIIMPINTLQNWLHEFNMWLPATVDEDQKDKIRPREFKVFILNDNHKTLAARSEVVLQWAKDGGVLMIGYEMYRLLSMKKMSKTKRKVPVTQLMTPQQNEEQKTMFDSIHEALVSPGPDLVICDEGHRIKNSHASISVALKQIKSKRRIVLTGYPLQNNLMEYWCMVDFVRPNYLGTKTEFSNMFERPIQNGQCIDSTPQDCKLMRYRAHVLHSLLLGFVQRRSHLVLQSTLPRKQEFVLMVRMTPFQRKLYDTFMNEVVRTKNVPNPLKAFAVCCKIWNHPDVLYNFLKKREADIDLELDDVLETQSSTSSATQSSDGGKKRGRKAGSKNVPKDKTPEKISEIFKPVALQASSTNNSSNIGQQPPSNSSASNFTQPPLYNNPYSAGSNSYHSTPEPYHNNTNYNFNSQPGGMNSNNSGYYQNYNQNNYWPHQNYYGQDQYNPHSFFGQNPFQSQGWFDQKTDNNQFGWNSNGAPNNQNNHGIENASTKSEVKDEKPVDDDKTKDSAISSDNKLADEIKEEVENAKVKDDSIPYDWALDLLKGYVPDQLSNSPKMEIFFCLLEETILHGDRMLLFSQSLLTLNVIEKFLQRSTIPNSNMTWCKNVSYFRLDGSTVAQEREKLINEFNSNRNVHLFLVSTRAGSLGINLVGANRVVVFDTSWNPCHDTQAVCRVYRYGQQKPCFVYRIVMDVCLEKKIYDRQINKQGMSDRVVDECNPDAYLSMKEITNLCYDDEETTEVQDFSNVKEEYADSVIQTLLDKHSFKLTKKPFQHESLFVDRKEKKLSSAEKRLAQRGYEMEKQASTKPAYTYTSMGTQYRAYRTPDGQLIHKPVQSLGRGRPPLQDKDRLTGRTMPRPTTWIPADVWIKQGMEAREMTLPLDVVIPTSSQTKENIILKAGQRVMVLKSTKGIYMQLETGKIIAIRSTAKPGQSGSGTSEPTPSNNSSLMDSLQGNNKPPGNKIESDDDECVMTSITYPTNKNPVPSQSAAAAASGSTNNVGQKYPIAATALGGDQSREKPVFKPNLVQRKPRSTEGLSQAQSQSGTSNGNSHFNYNNQHYNNYDDNQRSGNVSIQSSNNNSFAHANAQNFSSFQLPKVSPAPSAAASSSSSSSSLNNFKASNAIEILPTQPSYPIQQQFGNINKSYYPPIDPSHASYPPYNNLPYAGHQIHHPSTNGGSYPYNANSIPQPASTNPANQLQQPLQPPPTNANNPIQQNNWQQNSNWPSDKR